MAEATIQSRLSDAWRRAVGGGKITNVFIALDNDPKGRWSKGEVLIFGLRLSRAEPEFYAFNQTTSRPVERVVEERNVVGTDFRCHYSEHRTLLPRNNSPPIGRQPELSADVTQCRFFQNPQNGLILLRRDPLMQLPLN